MGKKGCISTGKKKSTFERKERSGMRNRMALAFEVKGNPQRRERWESPKKEMRTRQLCLLTSEIRALDYIQRNASVDQKKR